ncbi:hypothetical protein HYPSUDRAFT_223304 [Hypholoma sublateritium FD-334 SS-4]|uniref:Putative lipoate-protein ligase A n=1 Tax=Hypholoma sublateritium (strain FD-334 SS-4) TaxID=945553 RepID=A0A0D2QD96_HYPSF|nr:hypothetical protein HYPSUDRAFT_223304 [Hypholoma sublateritium FD-334 SS-4]
MYFCLQATRRAAPAFGANIFSRWTQRCQQIRRFSAETSTAQAIDSDHEIYVSTSINPYFNLSLEDWLFRHSPETKPLLLIYRDAPCVVIGRNQNPWTELNFPALRAANTPFLRRRSGGGAVYHDLGNTNFSIHLPRMSFDRHATGRLVLRAVQSLGIDAHLNDRNDICVGLEKVSGSAYKIVNKRAYHHGTMLLTTQLSALGDFLRPQAKNIITKGVASVRSPVCNLQKYAASAMHETFTSAVVAEFRKEYGITSELCTATESQGTAVDYIQRGMDELNTWEWAYGQTPSFTHTMAHAFPWGDVVAQINSKHGLILDVSLTAKNTRMGATFIKDLNRQCQALYTGQRYGHLRQNEAHPAATPLTRNLGNEWTEALRDVDEWLLRTTSAG